MTSRLLLVGLVAALGLTIPQWSNEQTDEPSPQDVVVEKLKNQVILNARRTGRPHLAGQAGFSGSAVVENKPLPPLGVGVGSGLIRPASKTVKNFWHIPNGARAVQVSAPVAHSSEFSGPPAHLKIVGRTDARMELAAQLGQELAFSHDQKTVTKVSKEIVRTSDLVESNQRAFEGIAKLAARPEKSELSLLAAHHNTRPVAVDSVSLTDLLSTLANLEESTEAALREMALQVEGTGRAVWTSTQTIVAGLWRKHEEQQAALKVASIVSESRPEPLADFPDDVFTAIVTPVAATDFPAEVFADAPKPQTAMADFPSDVFSEIAIPQQTAMADFPDNVFAQESTGAVVTQGEQPRGVVTQVEPVKAAVMSDLPDNVFAPAESPAQVAIHVDAPSADLRSSLDDSAPLPDPAPAEGDSHVNAKPVSSIDAADAGEIMTVPRLSRDGSDSEPARLTRAVSLTRDAAMAWMKILSGPAVVTLAR